VEALEAIIPAIAQLVASSQLRILDLVCLAPTPGGEELVPLELDEVTSIAALRHVDGEFGGLLSESDVQVAAFSLPRTGASLLLLAEDLRLGPLSAAARACGGRVLGGERTPRARVQAALAGSRQHLTTIDPDDPDDPGR
jgi:hypothetical protein